MPRPQGVHPPRQRRTRRRRGDDGRLRAREVGAEYRAVFEKLGVDDVKVHVISHGFKFDLANRRPVSEEKERVEENAAGAEKAARPEADEGEVE